MFRSRKFLITAYCLISFLVVAGLWMIFSGFLFCVPVKASWSLDYEYAAEHCLRMGPVWYINAALQISTDIVIIILPLPLVAKLQLPRRQKVGIMLVFGIGIL